MLKQFFETRTFCDHAGEPSFGRRGIFWVLLFLGLFCACALAIIAKVDPKHAKSISDFVLGVLGSGATIVSILYGSAQVSKGMAQWGTGIGAGSIAPTGALAVPMVSPISPASPATVSTVTAPPIPSPSDLPRADLMPPGNLPVPPAK